MIIIIGIYLYFWKAKADSLREKFTIWLIFSVVLALTPIGFNGIWTFISGKDLTITQLLKNGELLIIAVAIGGDAIGKLFLSDSLKKISGIISGGACFLFVIYSAYSFAAISTSSIAATDPSRAVIISIALFLLTVLLSGTCVVIAEIKL